MGNFSSNVFIILLCILIFLLCKESSAQIYVKEVPAEYTYKMGDDDSCRSSEKKALQEAKRLALEEAGTYLSSIIIIEKALLTYDDLTSLASGFMSTKILDKICKDGKMTIKILAKIKVDEKHLQEQIKELVRKKNIRNTLENYIEIKEGGFILKKPYQHKFGLYPNEVINKIRELGGRLPSLQELEEMLPNLEFTGSELCIIGDQLYSCRKGIDDRIYADFINNRRKYQNFRWVLHELPSRN